MPTLGPDGPVFPEGQPKPIARDFTPRRYDRAARELDLEFVLHHPGPASTWAAQARVGQTLGIGGPRGSFVIPNDFDWHLLIGDDTALPAIARRLEELPAGARVAAVLEVADFSAQVEFRSAAELHLIWRHRDAESVAPGGDSALLRALRDLPLPSGDGYVWAAGEAAAMRAVRQHLCGERGVDKARIRAAAYWNAARPRSTKRSTTDRAQVARLHLSGASPIPVQTPDLSHRAPPPAHERKHRSAVGEATMQALNLIIQLASGATGGNVAGALAERYGFGPLGNTIAGLVGGGIGGELIKAALGASTQAASGFDLGTLLGDIGAGSAGGACVTIATGLARAHFAHRLR